MWLDKPGSGGLKCRMYMSLFHRLCICVYVSTNNASGAGVRGLVGTGSMLSNLAGTFRAPPPP